MARKRAHESEPRSPSSSPSPKRKRPVLEKSRDIRKAYLARRHEVPRFTEQEMRRMDREDLLKERAKKLEDKDERAKENKRKRDAKAAKEKQLYEEQRMRLGGKDPNLFNKEQRWGENMVSPSQVTLGKFFAAKPVGNNKENMAPVLATTAKGTSTKLVDSVSPGGGNHDSQTYFNLSAASETVMMGRGKAPRTAMTAKGTSATLADSVSPGGGNDSLSYSPYHTRDLEKDTVKTRKGKQAVDPDRDHCKFPSITASVEHSRRSDSLSDLPAAPKTRNRNVSDPLPPRLQNVLDSATARRATCSPRHVAPPPPNRKKAISPPPPFKQTTAERAPMIESPSTAELLGTQVSPYTARILAHVEKLRADCGPVSKPQQNLQVSAIPNSKTADPCASLTMASKLCGAVVSPHTKSPAPLPSKEVSKIQYAKSSRVLILSSPEMRRKLRLSPRNGPSSKNVSPNVSFSDASSDVFPTSEIDWSEIASKCDSVERRHSTATLVSTSVDVRSLAKELQLSQVDWSDDILDGEDEVGVADGTGMAVDTAAKELQLSQLSWPDDEDVAKELDF